jgi:hypothetical protein
MNYSVQTNSGNKNHFGDKQFGLVSAGQRVMEWHKTVDREGKASSHVVTPRHRNNFRSLNTANQHNSTIEVGPHHKKMLLQFSHKIS